MNFTGNILLQDRKLGEHMTIDEMMIEIKQQGYDFEHAMCDIEDSRENQVMYQEKGEQCKQLVDFLAELKKYKQLEEQGRLIKLPCKVGDTVYHLCEVFGLLKYNVDEIIIDKTITYQCSAYSNPIGDCPSECLDEIEPDISEFGKTVFLTLEEAKEKLKELRGNQS